MNAVLRTLLVAAATAGGALAHDPGLSSATVLLARDGAEVRLAFNPGDFAGLLPALDRDGDGRITAGELDDGRDVVAELLAGTVRLRFDGAVASLQRMTSHIDATADVVASLLFDRSAGSRVELEVALLARLPRGHRQYASVLDADGGLRGEAVLHAQSLTLRADLDAAAPSRTAQAWEFLVLGVEHILIGYDHILFLLALLVVGATFRSAVAVITSFTVAHSLTLAAASLDLVDLPGSLVEPVIALSIVWVAVENLVRKEPRHRWRTTFCFGLVHGFGFASVLRELGIAEAGGVALPLVSFNVGVEIGQIAIAAIALPLIWTVQRRTARGPLLARALSLSVGLAGAFWLCERTLLG